MLEIGYIPYPGIISSQEKYSRGDISADDDAAVDLRNFDDAINFYEDYIRKLGKNYQALISRGDEDISNVL